MKLRFRGNTLRLRVNRREVEALAAGRRLEEQVFFPGGSYLSYALEQGGQPSADASFEKNTIRVSAPACELRAWAADESIGLYFDLAAGEGTLRLMIEKDLECVDGPPEEYDPDAFARPASKSC
ncbi:MAG TPA: hypothetical protein VH477_12675 [Bryobacteraceae bacterium]|jgi:hypothetical protein